MSSKKKVSDLCPLCGSSHDEKAIAAALRTCPSCEHHYRMEPQERISYIADPGSFQEFSANIRSLNPIDLSGYEEKLSDAEARPR